jgi:hypothetical protein
VVRGNGPRLPLRAAHKGALRVPEPTFAAARRAGLIRLSDASRVNHPRWPTAIPRSSRAILPSLIRGVMSGLVTQDTRGLPASSQQFVTTLVLEVWIRPEFALRAVA